MSAEQELQKMWRAFLSAGGAENINHRFHFICPENSSRLPPGMSLSAQLLASPRALKRVQMLRHGMPGYIVPTSMKLDEVRLSKAV